MRGSINWPLRIDIPIDATDIEFVPVIWTRSLQSRASRNPCNCKESQKETREYFGPFEAYIDDGYSSRIGVNCQCKWPANRIHGYGRVDGENVKRVDIAKVRWMRWQSKLECYIEPAMQSLTPINRHVIDWHTNIDGMDIDSLPISFIRTKWLQSMGQQNPSNCKESQKEICEYFGQFEKRKVSRVLVLLEWRDEWDFIIGFTFRLCARSFPSRTKTHGSRLSLRCEVSYPSIDTLPVSIKWTRSPNSEASKTLATAKKARRKPVNTSANSKVLPNSETERSAISPSNLARA